MSAPAACTIFSGKAQEILYRGQAGPVDWQATERAERRWDAKVARTLIVALPHELSLRATDQSGGRAGQLAAREPRLRRVSWAVHEAPGDPRNRHGHLVMTTRRVDEDGKHGEKTRELDVANERAEAIVMRWRQRWQLLVNSSLAAAGSDARIDHRSVEARGLARPARLHLGPEQAKQERQGYRTAAGRHNATVDEIERINAELMLVGRRIRHVLDLQRRARVKRQIRQARQRARWTPRGPTIRSCFHEHRRTHTGHTNPCARRSRRLPSIKKSGRRR